MAKRLLTECPYCHRKVSYLGAGILKTKGEHSCSGCKCISNVVIHRALYGIAGGAVVSALIILLIYSAYGQHDDIRGVLYVLVPFLIFYILVPFFVKLEPCNDKSAVNKLNRRIDPVPVQKKKPSKKQEQPIELNVGADFSSSFMKAKSSIKSAEDDNTDNYNRIIEEEISDKDINSGIDIDITGSINEPTKNAEDDNDIKVYKPSGEEKNNIVFETEKENEVSFFSANTDVSDKEAEEKINIEANNGNEVSFIFGRKNDDDL